MGEAELQHLELIITRTPALLLPLRRRRHAVCTAAITSNSTQNFVELGATRELCAAFMMDFAFERSEVAAKRNGGDADKLFPPERKSFRKSRWEKVPERMTC